MRSLISLRCLTGGMALFAAAMFGVEVQAGEKSNANGRPPWAQSGRSGGPGQFGDAHFNGLDANKDGKISKKEILAMHAKADANGDGAVTREELQKHIKNAARKIGGGRPSAETAFGKFDKNKDGKLSKDEVPGQMWGRLSTADSNKDGSVSKAEFEKAVAANSKQQGRPAGAGRGGQSPVNAIFDRFDKNKDGKLSKDEAPGQMWNRLSTADSNKDGTVSKEELEKMMGANGGGRPSGFGRGGGRPSGAGRPGRGGGRPQ